MGKRDNRERYVDDFDDDHDIEIARAGERVWLRVMHTFGNGGGWGRRIGSDGQLDNSREGMIQLSGDEEVLDWLKRERVKQQGKGGGDFDPIRDGGQIRLI